RTGRRRSVTSAPSPPPSAARSNTTRKPKPSRATKPPARSSPARSAATGSSAPDAAGNLRIFPPPSGASRSAGRSAVERRAQVLQVAGDNGHRVGFGLVFQRDPPLVAGVAQDAGDAGGVDRFRGF